MKILEIEEHNISADTIKRDCSKFLNMIEYNIKYVPVRDAGHGAPDHVAKMNTRSFRRARGTNLIAVNFVDAISKKIGLPSRYEHALITSSTGSNTSFSLDYYDSGYIIPVGDFSYAYISNDFNDINSMSRLGSLNFEITDHLHDESHNENYMNLVRQYTAITSSPNMDTIHDELDSFISVIEEQIKNSEKISNYLRSMKQAIDLLYKDLSDIRTSNYKNAFSSESEIWFNCKKFYFIPLDGDNNSKEIIENLFGQQK